MTDKESDEKDDKVPEAETESLLDGQTVELSEDDDDSDEIHFASKDGDE